MSKDNTIKVVAVIAGIILIVTNFEIVKILPVNQKKKYNYEAPTALGTLVFHQMLKKLYGDQNIKIVNHLNVNDTTDLKNKLVFRLGDRYEPLDNDILHLVDKGLNAVVAAHTISIYADSFSINTLYNSSLETDTFPLTFGENKKESYRVVDTFIYFPNSYLDISKNNVDTIGEPLWVDSTNVQKSDLNDIANITSQKSIFYNPLITSDTSLIAFEMRVGKGKLLVHCFPRIFTNLGSLDSKLYTDHLNFILSRFNAKKIIILNDSQLITAQKSKFSVLLKNRSLKAAYFTMLLGVLFYLLFGLKRRMRPVPIFVRKENTTLQYVDILSRLYQNQNAPYKLAGQMRKNFDEYVQHHYHLSPSQTDFMSLLSKKSKVDFTLIQSIYGDLARFEGDRNLEDIKLITLHNKIQKFKSYAKR